MKYKMGMSLAKSALEAGSHNAGAPFKINIANKGRTTPIETHSG